MIPSNHHITFVKHRAIDKTKWDRTIVSDPNGLIYATSFYLDCMAEEWDALVLNDYEWVMPLPVRKKMGVHYIFQPSMTPILGIFGKPVTSDLLELFLTAIPSNYKLWDISINHSKPIPTGKSYKVFQRKNFVLDLSIMYDNIYQQYHINTKRNIAKAIANGCKIKRDMGIEAVIAICKVEFPGYTKVEKGLFKKIEIAYNYFLKDTTILGITNENGDLLSAAVFINFNGRTIYWLVGNKPEGRNLGSSAMLIDYFIKLSAGTKLLLDFEGSDVTGIAQFYQRFGAKLEPYYTIFYNRLPFLISWIKPVPALYNKLVP